MRPPRSPQSDRRNLLNSAHRDFKSKRVERVIDEIGAPPSQHAPCPPRLSGTRFHDLCSRFKRDNKDSTLSSIRNLLSFKFSAFQTRKGGRLNGCCLTRPARSLGEGFRQPFKGSRFKSDPLHDTATGGTPQTFGS